MKILVTGGGGFLGRHVALAARAQGHTVCVLSRHPEGLRGLPEGTRTLKADLGHAEELAQAVAGLGPDAVIHAAAVVADDDPHLFDVNVTGTEHLLAALAALPRPPRLVHVSTFAVEDIPPTRYSLSKLQAEGLVRASGLPFVVLRPALIYGPGDGTNTPALVARMKSGSHWLPAGGRATRIQPVHVADVAEALVTALTLEAAQGRTYRLAGPEPMTVRAWREAVRDASGGRAAIRSIPLGLFGLAARAFELLGKHGPRQVHRFHLADHAVDIEDARRDLGFDPRPAERGLAETFPGGTLGAAP